MSEHVVTELGGGVLRIELRRPEKRNALTLAMYTALAEALEAAGGDRAVRAVLLHGQPEVFCAGNDVQDFRDARPEEAGTQAFRFLTAISTFEKPLVAAVAGQAIGIGTTILLHCDLVYAAESARLHLPFARLGLCPEAGSSLLLPRLAGHQRAAELLLLGEPFGAARAREVGLVNAVVPDGELMSRAGEVAAKLAALPASALRATKMLMKRPLVEEVAQAMREEGEVFRMLLGSPAAREALAAFAEKRQPDFTRFD
jgi:enoyl-CoA hydratase/carnithine racemase